MDIQEPIAWMVYTEDGKSAYVTDNPTDLKEGQSAYSLYPGPFERTPATLKEVLVRMHRAPRGVFFGHDPMTIWMEAWRAAEQHHGIKE